MPSSPRGSRHARRDDHRAPRHADDARHRPSQRSLSPRRSPAQVVGQAGRDKGSDRPRASRRHRSPHRDRGPLPFGARPLGKADLASFEPLFAEYLELQKQRDRQAMDEREVRGRWKRFVGRWNRGELAEGWYDPEVFQRALARAAEADDGDGQEAPEPKHEDGKDNHPVRDDEDNHDDDNDNHDDDDESGSGGEDYGPVLPGVESRRKAGAAIPSVQDLALRDEMAQESRDADREELRAARKADRAQQKERLEELVPRAEAGTRERKLEKRQEANDKMRQFREKSPGVEVGEKELMGGGDSLEEYRKDKERDKRRKSERNARREELARARREEIEEKRRAWQEREDKTVSMLRELAKQRFG